MALRIVLAGPWAMVTSGDLADHKRLTTWLDALEATCGRALTHGPRFYAGFAYAARSKLGELVTLQDQEAPETFPRIGEPLDVLVGTPLGEKLRSYQKEALRALFASRRGVAQLPTGSGKTLLAAAAIAAVPMRWLYLVHRRALADQTLKVFLAEGLLATDDPLDMDAKVVVATYQSALSDGPLRSSLPDYEGVIVDEAHAVAAPSYADVLEQTVNAGFRFGIGATPLLREDALNAVTIGLLGPVVYAKSVQELVEDGYLAPGQVRFRPFHHPTVTERSSYIDEYRKHITLNVERNRLLGAAIEKSIAPRLVIIRELDHAPALLESGGLENTLVLDGSSTPEYRERVLTLFRDRKLDTLICSSIGEMGLDLPEAATIVVASAGKAALRSIQRLGRGTRKAKGKFGFELIDVADTGGPGWLARHARARAAAYSEAGYLVTGPPEVAGAHTELSSWAPDVALVMAGPSGPRQTLAEYLAESSRSDLFSVAVGGAAVLAFAVWVIAELSEYAIYGHWIR